MKIFQVEAGICHWDASSVLQDLQQANNKFPPSVLFVEAPDEVFEGWGYLNGEFIKPTPPEGWLYDDTTGTFYPEDSIAPSKIPTESQRIATLEEQLAEADEVAIQLYESSLNQEAVNAEQDEAIIEIYETMEGLING